MLYVKAQAIETLADVQQALTNAIQLELSTIPPYLTALYSIMPGQNTEIAALIRSIAIEEMLHMCIACNIQNAVGGTVALTAPGFAPAYPGPLPMDIGTQPGGPTFIVPLQAMSIAAVQNTFMVIEEPEDPLVFATAKAGVDAVPDFKTIGEFYAELSEAIGKLGSSIFTGNQSLQVTGWFGTSELYPITNVATAQSAIALIMQQGEGTTAATSPLDAEGELAHYYKFAEIAAGKQLVPDTTAPNGFSYTGSAIPFDPTGVFPMIENPAQNAGPLIPANTNVAQMADQFDRTYSALLNALNATFNGAPSNLNVAIGLMYSLRVQAQDLMQQPLSNGTNNMGPRWLFNEASAQG